MNLFYARPRRLVLGALLAAGIGCGISICLLHSHATVAPAPPTSLIASMDPVQSMPLYQEAQAACSNGQYRRAADLLQMLIRTTSLSPAEQMFCKQQREICLRDSGDTAMVLSATDSLKPSLHSSMPEEADCGARALLSACQILNVRTSLPQLRKLAETTADGASLDGLTKAAIAVGLKAQGVRVNQKGLAQLHPPAIAWVNGNHFVTLLQVKGEGEEGTVTFVDPDIPGQQILSQEQFLPMSGGNFLILSR